MMMQPTTTISAKRAVTMQTALVAPEKKYDMHHNIRIQFAIKHHYNEHIPGKYWRHTMIDVQFLSLFRFLGTIMPKLNKSYLFVLYITVDRCHRYSLSPS